MGGRGESLQPKDKFRVSFHKILLTKLKINKRERERERRTCLTFFYNFLFFKIVLKNLLVLKNNEQAVALQVSPGTVAILNSSIRVF